MKISEIIFSPTGGTEKAAKIIAEELGDVTEKIDLTDVNTDFSGISVNSDSIAVIAVPSFGGRVPAPAAERLSEINGNGALAVVVCVYGNRAYEDTLVEIYDTAVNAGFKVIAAVTAVAEHSIMRDFAHGRPDSEDADELKRFSEKINDKIARQSFAVPDIKGNRPYKKINRAGIIPITSIDCKNCGSCAAVCPVGATDRLSASNIDETKCISCMRCVSRCPNSARSVNPAMVRIAEFAVREYCSINKRNELFI